MRRARLRGAVRYIPPPPKRKRSALFTSHVLYQHGHHDGRATSQPHTEAPRLANPQEEASEDAH
ncbi:hypothetical protein HaLaN_00829 [Haematococcus lacustris]|uniref:Uncharacterized protein n=1 Tax=Haematococcus lacustris TaxID=44745 RepID=A0A699Y842_HAELA|nr:hypothetical protein HaLaN_00829 [Haematococcus lacustris]